MGGARHLSGAAILLALVSMGCGNPCEELRCDQCATEKLEEGCLERVAVGDEDECQTLLDEAPSCE
jgi:hypothetical protein